MRAPDRARRPPRRSSRWRCCAPASFVQAFPEYGPERRGAPLRAYTRSADRPIRRHDAVEHPDLVVVLEPSLAAEAGVTEGLAEDGLVLVNAEREPAGLAGTSVACVPATQLASEHGSGFANVTMLGAVAPRSASRPWRRFRTLLSRCSAGRSDETAVRDAVEEGYRCLS